MAVKRKMKKKKSIWGTLLLVLLGVGSGFLTAMELNAMHATELPFWPYVLLLLGMVCAYCLAYFLQIVIHEAGHMVCGLLTGYRFSSFRVGRLMWVRQNGRIRLKRFSVAGTAGQCLLAPPPMVDGKIPYVLYNLGGCLANLAAAAVCFLLLPRCGSGLMHFFLLLLGLFGVGAALTNGIPMNAGGVPNDGSNVRSLRQNPSAMRAFWIQMKVSEGQAAGVRLKDMPPEWFDMSSQKDMRNGQCASLAVMQTSWLMDQREFSLAAQRIDALLTGSEKKEIEIHGLYRQMMACDRIFCALIGDEARETVARLLTGELHAAMKQMNGMPVVLRTRYVLALLYDRNPEEAAKLESMFEKSAVQYPHPAEIESEREFMHLAKEKSVMQPQVAQVQTQVGGQMGCGGIG